MNETRTHTLKDMSTHEWHVVTRLVSFMCEWVWQVLSHLSATHCDTLQHPATHLSATHCNTLQHTDNETSLDSHIKRHEHTWMRHTKRHEHTWMTRRDTSCLIHVWMRLVGSCLIHVWMTCHDLRGTHTLKDMSTHTKLFCAGDLKGTHSLQHTATHCNTLQHTATLHDTATTHCNILEVCTHESILRRWCGSTICWHPIKRRYSDSHESDDTVGYCTATTHCNNTLHQLRRWCGRKIFWLPPKWRRSRI